MHRWAARVAGLGSTLVLFGGTGNMHFVHRPLGLLLFPTCAPPTSRRFVFFLTHCTYLLVCLVQAAQWYDVQQLPKLAFDREWRSSIPAGLTAT